jgi:hypothetical protein
MVSSELSASGWSDATDSGELFAIGVDGSSASALASSEAVFSGGLSAIEAGNVSASASFEATGSEGLSVTGTDAPSSG